MRIVGKPVIWGLAAIKQNYPQRIRVGRCRHLGDDVGAFASSGHIQGICNQLPLEDHVHLC